MFDRKAYMAEYNKKYYRATIEHQRKRSKEYAQSEAGKASSKRWRDKNGKSWRLANIDKVREKAREWARKDRRLNPEKHKIANEKFRQSEKGRLYAKTAEYKESHKKSCLKYYHKAYKNDVTFKLRMVLRARLHAALKRKGDRKIVNTVNLLGCTPDELKTYLESLFETWMNWENYGDKWVIDHIMPCASYDLSDIEQQRKCFHYSNLRPLERLENLSKGDKIVIK